MSSLTGKHILSVDDFDRESLHSLYRFADLLQPIAAGERNCTALDGALLASLFFEPSTRTRVSFGAAFHRLGGKVVETSDEKYLSLKKGESLTDTARVFQGYVDVVVMRHKRTGAVREYAARSESPVINAGDGSGEHPTQALLDGYTIARELNRVDYSLDDLKIAVVGDLKHGRTVHSLAKLLSLYSNVTFFFISPTIGTRMPQAIRDLVQSRGHTVYESRHLCDGLPSADVVYATRIQEERFTSRAQAQQLRGRLAINLANYNRWAPHGPPIMHPLPRDSREKPMELSEDLEDLKSFAVFRQAENGVAVRMALFAEVLGLEQGYVLDEMGFSVHERQERWRKRSEVLGDRPDQEPAARSRR
jgi:aspartate carbamoyltransferase catalytic subunit